MSTKFPVEIEGVKFKTIEALYQSLKFPHNSDVQLEIINEKSPMRVKMISSKYKQLTREDWNDIRVKVMRWCLQVKFSQNVVGFTSALIETANLNIVENSSKDNFWGAVPNADNTEFVGKNALGRLLMELRERLYTEGWLDMLVVEPPGINDFTILKKMVGICDERQNLLISLANYWSSSKAAINVMPSKDVNEINTLGVPIKDQGKLF